MINRIIILFKIARKIGSSDIIEIVDKSHKVPFFIKLFFKAWRTILLVKWVLIPTFTLWSSIISNVYLSLRLGLLDSLTHTLLPFFKTNV